MSSFEAAESKPGGDVVAAEAMVLSANPWPRRIIEAAILLLGLGIALVVRFYILEPAVVISSSMKPTFGVDSRVLLDQRASLHGTWQRGDVVLFNVPESWKRDEMDEDTLMKRIIGLPGEHILVSPLGTYINGRRINEPYIAREGQAHDPVEMTLGENQYFVMGDNRNYSEDSRDHGAITDSDIRGRVILKFAPLSSFGRVARPDYDSAQP